jgi:uncharacterized protein YbbK (DUF523 family)
MRNLINMISHELAIIPVAFGGIVMPREFSSVTVRGLSPKHRLKVKKMMGPDITESMLMMP